MPVLAWSLLIGLVAGSRSMMAPTAISWAVIVGHLHPRGSASAFLGSWITVVIFTALAAGKLVADALPATPSRKVLSDSAPGLPAARSAALRLGCPRTLAWRGSLPARVALLWARSPLPPCAAGWPARSAVTYRPR